MSGLDIQIDLRQNPGGLKQAYWRLWSEKATGVLTLEWKKFKKQIAFKRGEPVLVRSNWPDETLAAYLLAQKVFEKAILMGHLKKKESSTDKSSLSDWLVKEGLIQAPVMMSILSGHFCERVFNLLDLAEGQISFSSAAESSVEAESLRFEDSFDRLLWDKVLNSESDKAIEKRLVVFAEKIPTFSGEAPLQFRPQDLKIWNQLSRQSQKLASIDKKNWKFIAALQSLGLLRWEIQSTTNSKNIPRIEDLVDEMRQLLVTYDNIGLHEVLGVTTEASEADLKDAYHELIRRYHPDRLSSAATPEIRKLSEAVFSRINLAFGTLTDPERREEYMADLELKKMGGVEGLQARLDAEFLIPQAQQALKRRQYAQAFELYGRIEKALSDDGEVIAGRVYAEVLNLGPKANLVDALQAMKKAIALKPNCASSYYYLGVLYRMKGMNNEAIDAFTEALALDSKLSEALSEVRLLRTKMGKKV